VFRRTVKLKLTHDRPRGVRAGAVPKLRNQAGRQRCRPELADAWLTFVSVFDDPDIQQLLEIENELIGIEVVRHRLPHVLGVMRP
jgi:hypothetical protein